jgi:tetratricopeptide (TPR) repeat protein
MRPLALLLLVLAIPGFARADLADARKQLQRGNYPEARTAYAEAAKDPKQAPAAAVGIAAAWRAEGESDKALDTLSDAIKVHPDHPDLLANRADLLYSLGRWDDALKDAEAAIPKQDKHFLARWVRARILRDKGDLAAADREVRWFVREYTDANQADRPITNTEALLIVGQAGEENARWHNLPAQLQFVLTDVYGAVLKADPDCWQAECLAGRMLLEKHHRADALAAFDKALAINPRAADALAGKGEAFLHTYSLPEAERYGNSALKVNPRHPGALRLKADVLRLGGDLAGAEKLLLAAKEVNPRDEATLARLAAIDQFSRRPEQFDAVVKEVEAFDAKPAAFQFDLGRCLEEHFQYEAATECYRKADQLRPMVPAARVAAALLAFRLGEEAEARGPLAAALKADPFDARVAAAIQVIDYLATYETVETPHFVLKFEKADKLLAAFLADHLEESHADLKRRYGFEPPGKLLVEVFATRGMFDKRAVALPGAPDSVPGACSGPVIAIPSPNAPDGRPYHWGRTVRHELARAFVLLHVDYRAPWWLVEGLAVRNEGLGRSSAGLAALRDRLAADSLLNLDTTGVAADRPLASIQARLYVEYVAQIGGEPAIGKLLDAFKNGKDPASALKQAVGVEREPFEAGYRKHVEAVVMTVGGPRRAPVVLTFEELEAAHQKDPDDPETAAKLAAEYLRRNRPGDARKLADAVLAKHKSHPGAAVVKARLLQRDKDDAGARAILEEARAAHPNDARVLFALGRLYAETNEPEKAAATFEAGRKAAPLDADWAGELVRVYAVLGRDAELIAVLADTAAAEPDNLPARLNLARVLLKLAKPAEAERAARDALFIDVRSPDARRLLIESLKAQKKDAEVTTIESRFQP